MNHDNHLPDQIDPELEARVVAWVLGEASPFEVAELNRLTAENPALAVFKRRIEAVHGLVGEAARPVREPLLLSPDRRAKLLAVIGASDASQTATKPEPKVMALPSLGSTKKNWLLSPWVLATAAGLMVVFVSLKTMERPYEAKSRSQNAESIPVELPVAGLGAQGEDKNLRDPQPISIRADYESPIARAKDEAHADSDTKVRQELEFEKRKEREFLLSRGASRESFGSIRFDSALRVDRDNSKQTGAYGSDQSRDPNAVVFGVGSPTGMAENQPRNSHYINPAAPAPSVTAGKGGAAFEGKLDLPMDGTLASAPAGPAWAAPLPDDEKLVLSPFTVTASNDRGYMASNTLAGTRIRSDLKDIGSSITFVTQQFLDDVGKKSRSASQRKTKVASRSASLQTNAPKESSASLAALAQDFLADIGSNKAAEKGEESSKTLAYAAAPTYPEAVAVAPASSVEADRPVVHSGAKNPVITESLRTELQTSVQPFSTFSLHVSDVSFRLAKAALDRGERPDATTIRPEEFYNAFDYGDPSPAVNEPVACRIEQSAHPFLQQRNLVRIAMKVPATGRGAGQPLRLTVLLDTSGSMEREDRAAAVRRALEVLTSLLGANDQMTLIGFARQPRLLADRVPGNKAARLVDLLGRTPSEGGTNLEAALKLAGEQARAQFIPEAQNRIVVLSDGAANLGNDDPAQLSTQVEALRQQGIAFDACGVGADGLDDSILEALTRKGDGRYYVINSAAEADAGFARQLAGAFRPAAQNVKVQVRFNPARVRSYRLIGFEQHRLRDEDFRNDQVDAAELAAEEAAVALYQVEVLPEGEGELGDVSVRFRLTGSSEMVERSWTLGFAAQAPAFDRASPSLQLAGSAAFLAEKLRGGPLADQVRLGDLAPVVNGLRTHYAHDPRVEEFFRMFEQSRRLLSE